MKFMSTVRALAALGVALQGAAFAAEIVVTIPGPLEARGAIGCGLFSAENGFPMDNASAAMQWVSPTSAGALCTFTGVADGNYAVSVLHDLNGNRRVDTNILGIPLEAWGVSGNARPTLRAPRFDEAMFKVQASQSVALQIRVTK